MSKYFDVPGGPGVPGVVIIDPVTGAGVVPSGGSGGGGGGDASAANQLALNTLVGAVDEAAPGSDTANGGLNARLKRIAQRLTSLIGRLPDTLGAKAAAASLSVTPATDASFTTTLAGSNTGVQTSVAAATTDTVLLAANAARRGAYIFNDSTDELRLLLGAGTSSNTVLSERVPAGKSFAIGAGEYTGVIKGNWAGTNGAARVTEFTAA